jgi:hypothetical protein
MGWYKCGKISAPLMRQQTEYVAGRPAFPDLQGPLGHQNRRLLHGFGIPSATKLPRDNGPEFIDNATEIRCAREQGPFTGDQERSGG